MSSSSLNRISMLSGSISDEVVVVAPELSLSVLDSVNVKIPSLFSFGICVVCMLLSPSSSNEGFSVDWVSAVVVVRIKGGVVDESVDCSSVVVVVGVDVVVAGVVFTIDLVLV